MTEFFEPAERDVDDRRIEVAEEYEPALESPEDYEASGEAEAIRGTGDEIVELPDDDQVRAG
ncbi:hypothetical protein M6D93_03965 [Jatrophihabitans telluris]|uniref:DUF5709 domain-containing protein n=1 Tax=Jatrophihabitans telluris TaxID=2038343 RepID=A0ABY4R013_9ACTN|nr:hypothetical protein [Jatrophihabitans telluris]UQX89165.1 hypothetical protein M6D93_03965 [Jatrophihabitans telluris]